MNKEAHSHDYYTARAVKSSKKEDDVINPKVEEQVKKMQLYL